LKQSEGNYRRIVIKVGGSLFVNSAAIENIISQIAGLVRDKIETIVVSSGAIACGMAVLKLEKRPKNVSTLQAVAALGQNELMNIYRRGLGRHNLNCGQVLLTWEDFDSRERYLNARNTILRLIGFGVVPVINENDTVSIDEIKFGDNDKLSAMVSHLAEADLLIILTDVDGLLSKDRKEVIRVVGEITPRIQSLACPTDKQRCVGGMNSKLEAARMVMDSGLPCVIANGLKKDVIFSVLKSPQESGTLFLPKKNRLVAKKRWIAFGTKAVGKILVDKGARQALVENNKSLLCPGIKQVEGDFAAGDTVLVVDEDNVEFARGKVEYNAGELIKIMGQRLKKEVIHRDNLVIICRSR
jgi:glutamate 5-kinase